MWRHSYRRIVPNSSTFFQCTSLTYNENCIRISDLGTVNLKYKLVRELVIKRKCKNLWFITHSPTKNENNLNNNVDLVLKSNRQTTD